MALKRSRLKGHGLSQVLAIFSPNARLPLRRHLQHAPPPNQEPKELDTLLRAVQTKNAGLVASSFLAWCSLIQDSDSPHHAAAVHQAHQLPGPTFSEILRNLDPILCPQLDVAHGLCISQGEAQSSDLGSLFDTFGVRHHHRRVLAGMQCLVKLRNSAPSRGLTPADYQVMLRCAGAGLDYQAAKHFWSAMAKHGVHMRRTTATWTDFIKARFLTEPVYYQFHLGRVALSVRHLYSNRSPQPMSVLKRMDRLRFSINASMREPWNRRRDEPDEDMMRLMRHRRGYRGYRGHWLRALFYGLCMDEELLCTSIIAFARSGSLRLIEQKILGAFYGIHVVHDGDDIHVSGGCPLAPDSPIMPTARLLNAIVDGLGSLSHIVLAVKLVDLVSSRYSIPIPHDTWSKLLSWTYVCASKPLSQMRQMQGGLASTTPKARDVLQIWTLMTSPPHSVEPSFADCTMAVRAFIHVRALKSALDVLRNDAMPRYHAMVQRHHQALLDEVLVNDVAPCARATLRRRRAQTLCDHAHLSIRACLSHLISTASANRWHHSGPVAHVVIPNLVSEFADFLPRQISYRCAQGHVQLLRPGAHSRFQWHSTTRTSLPQKRAAFGLRHLQDSDKPYVEYPHIPSMRIVEWQRRPHQRLHALGRAPLVPHTRLAWWKSIQRELML